MQYITFTFLGGDVKAIEMNNYFNPDFIGPIQPPENLTKEQKAAFVISLLSNSRYLFVEKENEINFELAHSF